MEEKGCMSKKKKPWYYVKKRAKTKKVKYEYLYVEDLEKLNNDAKKKNKNHYLPDEIVKHLKNKYKIVLVTFKFLHNEVEWRLVLFGEFGGKYETLTLDVDNLDKVYIGYYDKKEAA